MRTLEQPMDQEAKPPQDKHPADLELEPTLHRIPFGGIMSVDMPPEWQDVPTSSQQGDKYWTMTRMNFDQLDEGAKKD